MKKQPISTGEATVPPPVSPKKRSSTKQPQDATQPPPSVSDPEPSTPDSTPEADQMEDARYNFEALRKFGGRKPGSQNRVTRMTKEVISSLINDYQDSGLMTADFLALEPKDRIAIAEKMMQYTVPKMQATAVDLHDTGESSSLTERLRMLSQPPSN